MVQSIEIFSIPLLNLGLLAGAFALLLAGAEIFQGTLPATLGILFTSWDLGTVWGTTGFLNTLSAALALIGGGMVLLRTLVLSSNRMRPVPFLLAGLLYAVFIVTVVYHVVVLGVAAGGH